MNRFRSLKAPLWHRSASLGNNQPESDPASRLSRRARGVGNQSVIDPSERDTSACKCMDYCFAERLVGFDAVLDPKTEPIKSPRGSPSHQRTKDDVIENASDPPKTYLVIATGWKTNSLVVSDRDLFSNNRTFRRSNFSGPPTRISARRLSHQKWNHECRPYPLPSGSKNPKQSRGLGNQCGPGVGTRKKMDFREPQIPAFMKLRSLCKLPQAVHRLA